MLRAAVARLAWRPRAALFATKAHAFDAAGRAAALDELKARGWNDQLPGRDAIAKRFEFENFNEAFGFMTRVALYAEGCDHHPEWSNVYSVVHVVLATHDVGGVSSKDHALADFMDYAAVRAAATPHYMDKVTFSGAGKPQ